MAKVNLQASSLISLSTLIEDVARHGKKESSAGLYIDFLYIPASQCKMLADILQQISTETYGYSAAVKELCKKFRDAAN